MAPALTASERDRLGRFSASQLADCSGRIQIASSHLLPRHNGAQLVGCALTVRTRPGDHLMVQKALDLARAGDIVVVDGGGYEAQALVGEIMVTLAARRGVAGFVIDGAVRDLAFLSGQPLPVFATSACPRGPTRIGPGEINVPVSIGRVSVQPGDLLVGDADGITVLRRDELEVVLEAAQALAAKEQEAVRAASSDALERSWIDTALRAGGCDFTGA